MSPIIVKCKTCGEITSSPDTLAPTKMICAGCGRNTLGYWCSDHGLWLDKHACPECKLDRSDPSRISPAMLDAKSAANVVLKCEDCGNYHPVSHSGMCDGCGAAKLCLWCRVHNHILSSSSCPDCRREAETARIPFTFVPAVWKLGRIQIGQQRECTVTIARKATGYIKGDLRPDVPWLCASEHEIASKKHDKLVKIRVAIDGLPAGQISVGHLALVTKWGTKVFTVEVEAEPPAIKVGSQEVHNLVELMQLLPSMWDDAVRLVDNGSLQKWLKLCCYPTLKEGGLSNERLQCLAAEVDPSLKPSLWVSLREGINIGMIEMGLAKEIPIQIRNSGVGHLCVRVVPTVTWVKASSKHFVSAHPKTIPLTVCLTNVPVRVPQTGQVFLESEAGKTTLSITAVATPAALMTGSNLERKVFSVPELLSLAREDWGAVVKACEDGRLERWLELNRLPPLCDGVPANERVQRLIAAIDPLLTPALIITDKSIEIEDADVGTRMEMDVPISNSGVGDISVDIVSNVPWLVPRVPRLAPSNVGKVIVPGVGASIEVAIDIIVEGMPIGVRQVGQIDMRSAWGNHTVTVGLNPRPAPIELGGQSIREINQLEMFANDHAASLIEAYQSGAIEKWMKLNDYKRTSSINPPETTDAQIQYVLQATGARPTPNAKIVMPVEVLEGLGNSQPSKSTIGLSWSNGCLFGTITTGRGAFSELKLKVPSCRWPDVKLVSEYILSSNGGDKGFTFCTPSNVISCCIDFEVDMHHLNSNTIYPVFFIFNTNAGRMAGFVLCGTRKEESHSVISTIQNFFRNSLDFYDHNKLCASRENIPLLEKAMAEWASLYIQGWSKVLPESSIALGWNSYIRNYGSTGYMVKEAALAMKRLECQTNSSTAANSRPIGTETAAVSFLIIDSDPTGAEVWLNGQKRQHLSPTGYNVQVGKRLHVELRKDNYYPWQKDIDVNWYAKKVFRAKLKPIGNGSDRVEG